MRHGKLEEPQSPHEVDDVRHPCDDIDEGNPSVVGHQHGIVQAHSSHQENRREGHGILNGKLCQELAVGLLLDVQFQHAPMRHAEDRARAPGRPDCAQLAKAMALRVDRRCRDPVGEEIEDANASVAVMHGPFLLQAAVELEVLWIRTPGGCRCSTLGAVEILRLVLVPLRHPALAAALPLRSCGVLLGRVRALLRRGLLGCRHDKGNSEDVRDPLLLKHISSASRLVKLLGCRDGQTHAARQHVGHASGGAS
mmetsp:Transcript_121683/g.289275  ORF Transcript_121683/g.289275 Transcript_121683/m.289275 type:complete len:253 (+) Transcript_121683:1243-2001(+)